MRLFVFCPLLVLIVSFISACSTIQEELRPDPAPMTDFLPDHDKLRVQKADCPVNRFWTAPGVKWDSYNKIIVSRVDTSRLMKQSWWAQVNTRELVSDPRKDCETIARYTENSFMSAILHDKKKRFMLVSAPGEHTLYLELAVVELVPSKPFLNAVENTAGFFIPGFGLLTMANKGSVAIEGKIVDSATGKIICMYTDREVGDGAVIDLASLTWYRHAEIIIDHWSKEFVEIANSPKGLEGVKEGMNIKAVAW